MVEVRYFAAIADAVGKDSESLELPADATVADLRIHLADAYGPDSADEIGPVIACRHG